MAQLVVKITGANPVIIHLRWKYHPMTLQFLYILL